MRIAISTGGGDARYDITVGRGILGGLGEALPPAARKVRNA